jgi:selenocysteine lyase/cysteine desulfurase
MDVAQRFGVKHVMVQEREGRIYVEDLLKAVTPRTRMIALSHVEFASGYRCDMAAVGKFCRERGILFCVDAIQSCGVVPVDVKGMHIDFLSAGGHKWMLGPEGLGIFYCRKELITSVHPEVGAMNVINALDYLNYDFTLRSDAKRFECSGYNLAGVLALGASLSLILEMGIELIWKRVYGLTSMLVEGLREKGYTVYSPREKEEECSGIVSFISPRGHGAHGAIVAELEKQKIVIVERDRRLRAAPHFYQEEREIGRLLEALP